MTDFSTEQFLPFAIKLVDGKNRPKDYEGDPKLASSDDTVATVEMVDRANGRVMSGVPGSATVTVTVDADLGEGVQEVIGTLDVTVTLDERTSARIIQLEAGAPQEKE